MNRTLHRKWTGIWKDIFSFWVFKMDLIDGFKYRTGTSWFFLLVTLGIFSLLFWRFFSANSILFWGPDQWGVEALFYVPLLITIIYWFRACLIYDFVRWNFSDRERMSTKKNERAKRMLRVSVVVFAVYYGYWICKMWISL